MLEINRKNIWHGSDSNPEPIAWEPCCPKPTAVIYFWIKRVGNFGLKKKEKQPYWMNNFSCILHMRWKIKMVRAMDKCAKIIFWAKNSAHSLTREILKPTTQIKDLGLIVESKVTSKNTLTIVESELNVLLYT